MKEINFNKDYYIRGYNVVKKMTVDESNLIFIDGVAIADANVTIFDRRIDYTYDKVWKGIVTKNFEEIPADINNLDNCDYIYYLFEPEIKNIKRFDNHFFVNYEGYDNHYVHLQKAENKNEFKVLKNDIKNYSSIYIHNTFIVDNSLYDLEKGKKYTREFLDIKILEDTTFLVTDKIDIKDNEDNVAISEILTFKMDVNGNILSSIISSIETEPIKINGDTPINYEQFRALRQMELNARLENINDYKRMLIM